MHSSRWHIGRIWPTLGSNRFYLIWSGLRYGRWWYFVWCGTLTGFTVFKSCCWRPLLQNISSMSVRPPVVLSVYLPQPTLSKTIEVRAAGTTDRIRKFLLRRFLASNYNGTNDKAVINKVIIKENISLTISRIQGTWSWMTVPTRQLLGNYMNPVLVRLLHSVTMDFIL